MRRIIDTSDPVNWSHPLNRGLVSWWLALPDQQRGVIFRDLCNRNNGTLTNGPTWQGARGRPGGWGSLRFDGSNDYIDCGTSGLNNLSHMTAMFWMRAPQTNTAYGRLFEKGATTEWCFNVNQSGANDGKVSFFANRSGFVICDSAAINDGVTFHHIAGTIDGANITLFVDGVQVSQKAYTGAASTTGTLYIGRFGGTGYHAIFEGDDFRLYNRALSAREIARYYNLSRQGYPGLLNRLPTRRYAPEQAVAGGLSIPIAAYHYNHHLGSMA